MRAATLRKAQRRKRSAYEAAKARAQGVARQFKGENKEHFVKGRAYVLGYGPYKGEVRKWNGKIFVCPHGVQPSGCVNKRAQQRGRQRSKGDRDTEEERRGPQHYVRCGRPAIPTRFTNVNQRLYVEQQLNVTWTHDVCPVLRHRTAIPHRVTTSSRPPRNHGTCCRLLAQTTRVRDELTCYLRSQECVARTLNACSCGQLPPACPASLPHTRAHAMCV